MADAFFISPSDRKILVELLHSERARAIRSSAKAGEHVIQMSPEVYIAHPQGGVIPGREGIVPGHAPCDIWQLNPISGDPTDLGLALTTADPVEVYNMEVDDLTFDSAPCDFVLVERDKFGNWIASEFFDGKCGSDSEGSDSEDTSSESRDCEGDILDPASLPIDRSPKYVVGISDDGCYVKVPLGDCDDSDDSWQV